jgi:energy-coupling factor transporter ATP-binding protein EcfA2
MRDLADMLNQPVIVDVLIERLSEPGSRAWLQGPSGSGKSTIIGRIAELLESAGVVVRIAGDAGHSGTRFLALHRALTNKRPRRAVRDAMKTGVTAPLRLIPLVGGAAADLAKVAVAGMGTVPPEFLSAEQQDLLQGLQSLSAGRPLFIIVDDVGWLDPDTAELLLSLARPEVRRAYSFAGTASILFVENLDAEATLNSTLLRKLRAPDPVAISRTSRSTFPKVLQAFGLKRALSRELLDALYAISQGHLEVAKQIVRIDEESDLQNLARTADVTALMSELLSARIAGGGDESSLFRLLAIAARAGSAFLEVELRCAFMDEARYANAFEEAVRKQLLSVDGDVVQFVHEVVRAAAERLGSPSASALHGKLAECVKLLRPGDYPGRFRHALLSDNAEQANELAFALAMQVVRGERDALLVVPDVGCLTEVLDALTKAYRLMDRGDHREAISRVLPYYSGEFSVSQGEIVAVIALNQIKRRSPDSYSEAAGLLEHWREWREEPELWQRLMSILVTAWIQCGETERASQLYTALARDLMRQSKQDPASRTRVEALNRKADMVFTSEIAVKHITRAVEWFGPLDGGDTPRHAFEYTASLLNLAGAQFTLGRFSSAAETAAGALQWIEILNARGLRTAEPYKAVNNYVIAAYRAGLETARSAGDALGLLLADGERARRQDRSLLATNRAALFLLAEQYDQGRELLERVWRHVLDENLDDYYALYVGSNLAVARAITGEQTSATVLIETLGVHINAVPRWFRSAHARRLALLVEAIAGSAFATAEDLDAFPATRRPPHGDQDPWWSIGRGLLMSDIQVWSEG